jgi:hypothetical protein
MSFASPFPDVDIPSASVYEYLFGNLDDADGDRVALVDAKHGGETSYRELIRKIESFAGAPAGRGVAVGDWSACSRPTARHSPSPFTASCARARRPPRSTSCSRPRTSSSS